MENVKNDSTLKASNPSRRDFIGTATAVVLAAAAKTTKVHAQAAQPVPAFDLEEATIADLQARMQSGELTARSLTQQYLERIQAIDKRTVNAIIELNPDALQIADAVDQERRSKGATGPLHGIPVLIKDNIDTADK